MLYYKTNRELLEEMNQTVVGHEEAKKSLILLVDRAKRRHHQKMILGMYDEFLLSPMKVLMIGASGTGKTFLVESLQKLCNFPLVKVDATKFNPTGASGGIKARDLEDMIYDEAKRWVKQNNFAGAEFHSIEGAIDQTVVFVDEIDKLGKSFDSSGNWNSHTQSNFLTLFDNKSEYAGVSFIFAGAFTDMLNKTEVKKNSIGFSNYHEKGVIETSIDEKVIEAGLIPELVGRLSAIVKLDVLSIDTYLDIIHKHILPQKLRDLSSVGILEQGLSEEELISIAEKAMKSGQGVRMLKREIEKRFLDIEFYYEETGNIKRYLEHQEFVTSLAEEFKKLEDLLDKEGETE